jgi:hypothetical protein
VRGEFGLTLDVKLAQLDIEQAVESRYYAEVLRLATGDVVKLLLQRAGVVVLDESEFSGERVDQQLGQV